MFFSWNRRVSRTIEGSWLVKIATRSFLYPFFFFQRLIIIHWNEKTRSVPSIATSFFLFSFFFGGGGLFGTFRPSGAANPFPRARGPRAYGGFLSQSVSKEKKNFVASFWACLVKTSESWRRHYGRRCPSRSGNGRVSLSVSSRVDLVGTFCFSETLNDPPIKQSVLPKRTVKKYQKKT